MWLYMRMRMADIRVHTDIELFGHYMGAETMGSLPDLQVPTVSFFYLLQYELTQI